MKYKAIKAKLSTLHIKKSIKIVIFYLSIVIACYYFLWLSLTHKYIKRINALISPFAYCEKIVTSGFPFKTSLTLNGIIAPSYGIKINHLVVNFSFLDVFTSTSHIAVDSLREVEIFIPSTDGKNDAIIIYETPPLIKAAISSNKSDTKLLKLTYVDSGSNIISRNKGAILSSGIKHNIAYTAQSDNSFDLNISGCWKNDNDSQQVKKVIHFINDIGNASFDINISGDYKKASLELKKLFFHSSFFNLGGNLLFTSQDLKGEIVIESYQQMIDWIANYLLFLSASDERLSGAKIIESYHKITALAVLLKGKAKKNKGDKSILHLDISGSVKQPLLLNNVDIIKYLF